MEGILKALFEAFYEPVCDKELEAEIDHCHKGLLSNLCREDRKLVVRLIDAKDCLTWAQVTDSFAIGFHLAWTLSSELSALRKPWSETEQTQNETIIKNTC